MRLRFVWLGAVVAGLLVWMASPELRWPARALTAVLLGPAPIAFMLQASAAEGLPRPLPRVPIYLGTMLGLWILGLTALGAGALSGFTARLMGLTPMNAAQFGVWTGFGLLASAAIIAFFNALGFRDSAIMREIVPVTAREKGLFIGLSVSAGICEEMAFRGFLLPALMVATGSLAGGVLLSSLAFGVLHAHQRAGGAIRATILGAALSVPLIVTGSVFASMAAHAIVDIVGGLWLARWLFK
jgi:membrane protease YdiL (CAAX protease family)